jgi:two-component system, LuxR family, sensor kinase FixL
VPAEPTEALIALLSAAVDGVVVIDHLGRVEAFNHAAERQFGYRAAELLGRNVSVLMTEEDRSAHDGHLSRYLAERVPHIIGKGREVTARRKDGSVFPAFLSVGVFAGADPPRFIGFLQDLSLRRRTEENSRRLQERLWHVSRLTTVGEMASGIAHELNQPLTAIANYAQACDRLLARPGADLEEIRGALQEIAGQAVRAGDIIRKLRGLARQEEGPHEATDINLLISELMDLVGAELKSNDVDYRLELANSLPRIELRRTQIQQVILNLTHNAIEALAQKIDGSRTLVLRTALSEGGLQIAVCDNGPGVSAVIRRCLFDPFCSSKPDGTGLGLAISRTIVERHRGTLDHRPNLPTGACFIVWLPLD